MMQPQLREQGEPYDEQRQAGMHVDHDMGLVEVKHLMAKAREKQAAGKDKGKAKVG